MNSIQARTALATALALATVPAGAANWLVLNSAEAPEGALSMALFGFIQPTYRDIDDSDKAQTVSAPYSTPYPPTAPAAPASTSPRRE